MLRHRPASAFRLRPFRAVLLAACALAPACSPVVKQRSPFAHLTPAAATDMSVLPYRIGIGDELEVKFFFTPELNDLVQVRPDGKISLMFAQDLDVAGHTPEEVAMMIKERVAPNLQQANPDLVVVMRSFASQKAYVGGEVPRPGAVQLVGGESLMQVLNTAGWITPDGRKSEVVLIRCCVDGREGVYAIDVSKIYSGEDTSQNITVLAGDQILVPPSDVAMFDRWMDQYVRKALPFNSSVVFTNEWGSSQ